MLTDAWYERNLIGCLAPWNSGRSALGTPLVSEVMTGLSSSDCSTLQPNAMPLVAHTGETNLSKPTPLNWLSFKLCSGQYE
jgi:hypothetical protein